MKKYDVCVYYFPNFHTDDSRNNVWHGKGWSEWEVLKNAKPRFEGHYVPKPEWGYEDEKDPKVMEKKIKVMVDSNITNVLFDWYWYDGPYLERALDEGYLQAY